MSKMSDDDFLTLVKRRRDAALEHQTDDRSADRREAMQFYRGDNLNLYGNSGDGLSTVVSRDLMEAVESILPGLIKPFIAGDEMVRFEPRGPEDEEPAKQATEYINYLFQNHNDPVRVVYDYAKDGLLFRLGVAKVVHETIVETDIQSFEGLTNLERAAVEAEVASDKMAEIVGDIVQNTEPSEDPALAPVTTFDMKVAFKKERSTYRVYIIAEEEFLFESRLATLDEARFLGHRATKPVGDFIAMGLPADKVKALKGIDGETAEENDRFRGESEIDEGSDEDDLARLVTIDECYIRCDREGTGVLSWRKVFIGAEDDDILLDEEADDHPYVTWTPIPLPHKLVGMSVFDLVRDLQMQGTALTREAFNALYLANRPQRVVIKDRVNIEDLLNPQVGGIIRATELNAIQPVPSGGEGVMQQSLAMLEQIATVREMRTGSTRYNQGLDANSLNKTATGISIIQNSSMQRQELVARMLAEGIKGIFSKMLGLVMRHMDKQEVIRLRGEWVAMDTKDWKAGYDMSVTVGLGTGNRDQQVNQLMQLLDLDQKIIQLQGGADGPLVNLSNVHEVLKRLLEAQGIKGVESYFMDPSAPKQLPQSGGGDDPMAEEQAKAQVEIEKAKIKARTDIEVAKIKAAADKEIEAMKNGFIPTEMPPELVDPVMAANIDAPQDLPEMEGSPMPDGAMFDAPPAEIGPEDLS